MILKGALPDELAPVDAYNLLHCLNVSPTTIAKRCWLRLCCISACRLNPWSLDAILDHNNVAISSTNCTFDLPSFEASLLQLQKSLSSPSSYDSLFKLDYVVDVGTAWKPFNGKQSLAERSESFTVSSFMRIHCGFVNGANALGLTETDRTEMLSCPGIVVLTAITRGWDLLKQPSYNPSNNEWNQSEQSGRGQNALVCSFAFADKESIMQWARDGVTMDPLTRTIGAWRILEINQLPYSELTMVGVIFKHLSHRLFPNARYTIWVDGKLQLNQHPVVLVNFFLIQHNRPFAVVANPMRRGLLEEAEQTCQHRPQFCPAIASQMAQYRNETFELQFNETTSKSGHLLGEVSDVCDSSLLLREHNPLTNLFSCLWYNELDRFHPRDQLSFGYVRRRMSPPLPVYLYPLCQRACNEYVHNS